MPKYEVKLVAYQTTQVEFSRIVEVEAIDEEAAIEAANEIALNEPELKYWTREESYDNFRDKDIMPDPDWDNTEVLSEIEEATA